MELFKTDILRREYKNFVENTLPAVIKCNYCNIDSCKWHKRFTATCDQCRKERCVNCSCFNLSRNYLFQNADDNTKTFLHSYIMDFLNISNESLECFYGIEKTKQKEKEKICFNGSISTNSSSSSSRSRNNNNNNNNNNNKINFQMKGRKRTVYIKKGK